MRVNAAALIMTPALGEEEEYQKEEVEEEEAALRGNCRTLLLTTPVAALNRHRSGSEGHRRQRAAARPGMKPGVTLSTAAPGTGVTAGTFPKKC